MKIEIKNIRYFPTRSEETNNFTADIYVDGIKVGAADNNGQGGNTNYWVIKNELVGKLKAAEKYAESLPPTKSAYGDITSNLEWVIDSAVDEFINNKEKAKFSKAREKATLKGIVYGTDDKFTTVSWKGKTLAEVLLVRGGPEAIKKEITKLKAKGENILNTNIPQELFA